MEKKAGEKKTGWIGGFLHIFCALSYSLQGLWTGFKSSLAIRQEITIFIVLALLAWYFDLTYKETFFSLCGWGLVIVAELFNSAIEEALDLITRDYSPQVKAGKDMGSAAVFLLVIMNIFGQTILYYPILFDK